MSIKFFFFSSEIKNKKQNASHLQVPFRIFFWSPTSYTHTNKSAQRKKKRERERENDIDTNRERERYEKKSTIAIVYGTSKKNNEQQKYMYSNFMIKYQLQYLHRISLIRELDDVEH